jgi:hypothetical protein
MSTRPELARIQAANHPKCSSEFRGADYPNDPLGRALGRCPLRQRPFLERRDRRHVLRHHPRGTPVSVARPLADGRTLGCLIPTDVPSTLSPGGLPHPGWIRKKDACGVGGSGHTSAPRCAEHNQWPDASEADTQVGLALYELRHADVMTTGWLPYGRQHEVRSRRPQRPFWTPSSDPALRGTTLEESVGGDLRRRRRTGPR